MREKECDTTESFLFVSTNKSNVIVKDNEKDVKERMFC